MKNKKTSEADLLRMALRHTRDLVGEESRIFLATRGRYVDVQGRFMARAYMQDAFEGLYGVLPDEAPEAFATFQQHKGVQHAQEALMYERASANVLHGLGEESVLTALPVAHTFKLGFARTALGIMAGLTTYDMATDVDVDDRTIYLQHIFHEVGHMVFEHVRAQVAACVDVPFQMAALRADYVHYVEENFADLFGALLAVRVTGHAPSIAALKAARHGALVNSRKMGRAYHYTCAALPGVDALTKQRVGAPAAALLRDVMTTFFTCDEAGGVTGFSPHSPLFDVMAFARFRLEMDDPRSETSRDMMARYVDESYPVLAGKGFVVKAPRVPRSPLQVYC